MSGTYEMIDTFDPKPGMSIEVYEEDLSYKAFCEDVRSRLDKKLPAMYEATRGYSRDRVLIALDICFDLQRVLKGKSIRVEDITPILRDEEKAVFNRLREARAALARREGVPAYRIFTNQALLRLTQEKPKTREELLDIPGIGMKTEARYGEEILDALRGIVPTRTSETMPS